jgi:nitrite reductase/ring-hydroxylating ferredoxin subunit
LVTKLFLESDIFYLTGMFSMKMKWVRFADSKADLEALLGKRSMTKMVVNGYGVLLVHHQDDYFLVKNKCPHQGAKLDHAQCEDGKIVCPWHHYGFDLKTGRGAGLYLENYPIEEREDGLYAGFEYFSWFGE